MNGMNGFVIEDSVPVKYAGPGGDVVPEGVTEIGKEAFLGCAGLTDVTLPADVTAIGAFAFAFCGGLIGVRLPKALVSSARTRSTAARA